MPFEIVRNDIVNMQVDAIVNTANPRAVVGYGTDAGIHQKAGAELLEARKKIGSISVGQAAVTPAFDLDAKYVIHAVGPVWRDGQHEEEELLTQCYRNSLRLAKENNCESIAFPLISTGNYGFPKELALQIAIREFSNFLMENEMQIYLVVFNRDALVLSEKLFQSVASYIDENYVHEKTLDEYGVSDEKDAIEAERLYNRRRREYDECFDAMRPEDPDEEYVLGIDTADYCASIPMPTTSASKAEPVFEQTQCLEDFLSEMNAGFSETLLNLIDRTGKKDSEVYKKANVDRKLFSKIRNNVDYKPSKATAIAFALALELDMDETNDFIGRAGYVLSNSSKFDLIVKYFISNRNYNIFELNEVLFAFDQPLISA